MVARSDPDPGRSGTGHPALFCLFSDRFFADPDQHSLCHGHFLHEPFGLARRSRSDGLRSADDRGLLFAVGVWQQTVAGRSGHCRGWGGAMAGHMGLVEATAAGRGVSAGLFRSRHIPAHSGDRHLGHGQCRRGAFVFSHGFDHHQPFGRPARSRPICAGTDAVAGDPGHCGISGQFVCPEDHAALCRRRQCGLAALRGGCHQIHGHPDWDSHWRGLCFIPRFPGSLDGAAICRPVAVDLAVAGPSVHQSQRLSPPGRANRRRSRANSGLGHPGNGAGTRRLGNPAGRTAGVGQLGGRAFGGRGFNG